jgi:hypothetical protein
MDGYYWPKTMGPGLEYWSPYVVYYDSMERKVLKPIYECRCNGRLQTKRFTRLTHTLGPVVELEHHDLIVIIVVYYESMKRKLI